MKSVWVTGATGFVARHLIPRLNASGKWRVIGVSRARNPPPWLIGCEWQSLDLTSWPNTFAAIERTAPAAIVHLAGQVRGSFAELWRANLLTATHLLQATRAATPQVRLVLFGSAAEYGAANGTERPIPETTPGEPQAPYGSTKCAATLLAMQAASDWKANVSVVRPFNVVGAHMPTSFVAGALLDRIRLAQQGLGSKPITVGRTDTVRDFVDVADLCDAVVKLLDKDERGEIYNLCSGRATTIAALLESVLSIAGGQLGWQVDPALVRPNDVLYSCGDCGKARERLGFAPSIPLEASLRAAWIARLAQNST